ncbi:hypothetical protein F0562_032500 [Nyssa sinensis]|uniref:GAG-pre-integrase domain-containing protein n=1 Tax=Nyssa sinensis TaxID=561372 RepID=A0A5J5AST7_9ASTE|nr:hypothetical protein F0562_032500 [Nyssa sinensis]
MNQLKGTQPSQRTWTLKNGKGCIGKTIGNIRQWLYDSVFSHVSNETDAQVLWKKLEARYEQKIATNKAFLIRKLVNMKFKEGGPIADYLNEFQSVVNQLATTKMVIEDELQAFLLLSSLLNSWETLVVTMSNSAPDGKLSMGQVSSSLFNKETRRKLTSTNNAKALVSENKGRSKNRGHKGCGKSKGRSQSRGKSTERGKCYHRSKEGHMKKNCYAWKREQKEENNYLKNNKEKNTIATFESDEVAVLSCGKEECLHVGNEIEWVVDTGASYYATYNKEFFTSYKAGDFGTVKMGNTSHSKIVGIGDVCIRTSVGCMMTLRDMRHVPDLRLNLISGIALDREGYVNYFGNGIWKLTKGSLVVARGKACCALYKTNLKVCRDGLNSIEDGISPNLWHKHLGHLSEKGLQILAKKSLIPFAKGNPSTIIKLNNMNWLIWKPKMEDILYCKDLYEPIEGDTAKPKDMDAEKWKRLHRKTIGNIIQWLDDSVFSHVSNETDAQVLWKTLEARYEQKTATNKAFLIRKLVNMKFKEGGPIADYLNEFQSIVNQLATMKMVIEDELQALLLLSSLLDS